MDLCPALEPVLRDAYASGMLTPNTAWGAWNRDRYAAGLPGQETAKDGVYVNAQRHYGGDLDQIQLMKAALWSWWRRRA